MIFLRGSFSLCPRVFPTLMSPCIFFVSTKFEECCYPNYPFIFLYDRNTISNVPFLCCYFMPRRYEPVFTRRLPEIRPAACRKLPGNPTVSSAAHNHLSRPAELPNDDITTTDSPRAAGVPGTRDFPGDR